MKKNNAALYICIAIFGVLGVYLTFFAGNINRYDSQTKAYEIDPNESYDSEDGNTYNPIYYFRVNGEEYECRSTTGSSTHPSEKKDTVYYDSKNPNHCMTEYEKSSNILAGIICLIVTAIMVYFFIIKKPSENPEGQNYVREVEMEQPPIDPEQAEKVARAIEKFQLIYKRVILGIIMAILLVFILIDTAIFKQTIVSRNYIDTTAEFEKRIEDGESNIFDDCVYKFVDKNGVEQEIIYSISKEDEPDQKIKIKYNEKNPQDYYGEGATLDKTGIIWYIVKIVIFALLVVLFFNKKLLNKIGLSMSRK